MTRPVVRLAVLSFAALSLAAGDKAWGQQAAQEKKPASAKAAPKPDARLARVKEDPALPRVLLIGDSISIGYTLPVRELLAGKANVQRIPTNGGPTIRGLTEIDKWLGDEKWDVIHFNWGLHDLKRDAADAHQVPLAEYEKNMESLVARLKKTNAKLIWAATTPVPPGKLSPPRADADVAAYNAAALKVAQKHGIALNDLYAFCLPQLKELQLPANVHFSPKGSQALAEQVAKAIQAALPEVTAAKAKP